MIERLANKARKSISEYCMEECKAHCCRSGFLILKGREINKVTQKRKKELMQANMLKELKNREYSLTMSKVGCPSLNAYKCIIHKSKNRPAICREFPIIIRGNTAMFSERCPAVRENRLYYYEKRFRQLGLEVIRGADLDLLIDSTLYQPINDRRISKSRSIPKI